MKIAVVYDFKGWAWWHRAHNIKANLTDEFDMDIVPYDQEIDIDRYDLITVFGHHPLQHRTEIPPEKLILGISNCTERSFGIVSGIFKSGGCIGALANNTINYEKLLDCGDPVFLCQNGVDTDFFHPAPERPDKPVVCWVGNPDSIGEKGLDIIEAACERMGVPLNIQAVCPPKTAEGQIPGQEAVRERYWESSIYICASLLEGTPNPALEAMACGLPVITTRVGNMIELLEDSRNGFFMDRSVDGLCRALERAAESDLAAMGDAARATVERSWTWKHQARKYMQMFRLLGPTG